MRLRDLCFTLLVVLVAGTKPASASGFSLAWDYCRESGGPFSKSFACDTRIGYENLVVAVVAPADMPRFIGASMIVDFWVCEGDLPPWWQVGTGQCRASLIRPSFDPAGFPLTEECPSLWGFVNPFSAYVIQSGLYGSNHFRLQAAAAVPAGSEFAIEGNSWPYVVARIVVSHAKSTGTDACAGCRVGAAVSLAEMKLEQPLGIGTLTITTPADFGLGWAGFNASVAGIYNRQPDCTTPTASRTWGQIKTLYR